MPLVHTLVVVLAIDLIVVTACVVIAVAIWRET